MKNRKNSHSLSKLQLKRTEYQGNSQRSLNKKYSKRHNQSYIQRFGTETPLEKDHNEAVRNQYYGTVQQGHYNSENESMIERPSKKMKMGKMMHEIEQKMKRVLQSQQFDSQIDIRNVVLEQQDVDQDFEEKILQNKHLLKQQRQKHDFNLSQYKHLDQTQLKKQNKKIKKLSLIQGKHQKLTEKLKSKSLLPALNPITSKLFQLNQFKPKEPQNKNQTQRKNLQLSNIYLLPNIKHKHSQNQQHSNHQHKSVESRLMVKNSVDINANLKDQKKLAELHKIISNKKSTQLKLQSKIEQLKSKIAQRTTNKQLKTKRNQNIQNIPQNKKVKRYSSHSVFDSIQQFLSNPHQNNSKSQRKFLKLYQKINDKDLAMQKEKQSLKKKIQVLQNKIKDIQQNPNQIILSKINTFKQQKIQIPTSAGSSPSDQIQNSNGSIIWRRMQGNKIEKSNFENEIKYVKSLEEKGRQNLANYIQNQKILHQLKLIKRTQQMLNKNERKMKSHANLQRHT